MSANTSGKERAAALLAAARRGEYPSAEQIRDLGETCPAEFFRDVIEPLADSFDPAQVAAYNELMRAWLPALRSVAPGLPARVNTVYVLSRVTLGADIKIVSPILAAMKLRFPEARIVFVANRKSAELFAGDPRIEHLNADYPRSGPVTHRLEFAHDLRARLEAAHTIVVDPDSRMTQLGLIPACKPENYFHFESRLAGGNGADNLTDLVAAWLRTTFAAVAPAFIAPNPQQLPPGKRRAAVSLGVGENEAKRVTGGFEARLIAELGARYDTVWVDRGVGGGEAVRVTAAVAESGVADRVRFWEGGFAGFASIIAQCDFYTGYDSAGQHAAAAAGVPLVSIFAGAPSERFRARWTASGPGRLRQIAADGLAPDQVLRKFVELLPLD